MTCRDIQERLTAYQEGTLSPEEKSLIKEHLITCAKCSSALAGLEKTVVLIKDLPEVEPPPWFTQKIMAQVREASKAKHSLLKRLFYPFHIKIPIEALATICVVALGLYVYKTSGPEIKTYQTPPTKIEAPAEALTVDKLKEETKPMGLSKTKPDKEVLSRQEPALKPSFRDEEAQRVPPETMMERKIETPVATGVAPPASAPSVAKEKDVSVSAETERKGERAKKAFQLAPLPRKADVQTLADAVITLFVENLSSASMDTEKALHDVGITITKRESHSGIQSFIVYCPAQKLQRLLERLRTIGDVKDSRTPAETTDGDLQITIRVVQR